MKLRLSTQREAGLTLFEVGVVIAVLLLLAAVLLPTLLEPRNTAHGRARGINCVNNLKQIGLAYRIWEGDNGDIFPMGISVTNGGSMEMVVTGNVAQTFMVMSNELSTPRILYCPSDTNCSVAVDFSSLVNSNISYFVGVNVTNDSSPLGILSGDGNFEIGGKPVHSGLVSYWTNDPVAWSAARHVFNGNLGLSDGSVQQVTSANLRNYFIEADSATNHLAIP